MITERERLEELEELIENLISRSQKEPIIVEGPRDVRALRALGIKGFIKSINIGNSIINFCETLSTEHGKFIILTDWDRKGGQLAQLLKRGFESSNAKYDELPRKKLARLTKKEVKDIEGLPKYMERLRRTVNGKNLEVLRKSYEQKKE